MKAKEQYRPINEILPETIIKDILNQQLNSFKKDIKNHKKYLSGKNQYESFENKDKI